MYDTNNIFAKIIRGEIPAKKIYEDKRVLAFHDAYPVAPIHILVIPKGEYISFHDFTAKAPADDIAHFFKIVNSICTDFNLEEDGYRISSNIGRNGQQSVFHMHLHILGGKNLGRVDSSRSS